MYRYAVLVHNINSFGNSLINWNKSTIICILPCLQIIYPYTLYTSMWCHLFNRNVVFAIYIRCILSGLAWKHNTHTHTHTVRKFSILNLTENKKGGNAGKAKKKYHQCPIIILLRSIKSEIKRTRTKR